MNTFGKRIYLKENIKWILAPCLFFITSVLLFGCGLGRVDQVLINDIPAQGDQMNLVQIIRKNQVITTQLNMELEQGDEIQTDSESTAIIWLQGGSRIILGPDTHIRLVNPNHIIELLSDIGDKISKLFIEAKGVLKVNTEYVSASSEGTEFYITQGPSHDVSITVLDGAIRLESRENRFSPLQLTRFQKAAVMGEQSARVESIEKDEANTIIEWINRIELSSYKTNARLLLPNVTGLPIHEAEQILRMGGFSIKKKIGRITGREPLGTILEQSPIAGTRMRQGGGVVLYFEAEPVRVPSLIGTTRQSAIKTIPDNRLTLGSVNEKITGTASTGMVIEQDPPAGTLVPVTSKVNLVVEAESVYVPDLMGMNIGQAREKIASAGLRTGSITEKMTGTAQVGTIIYQRPSPGKLVKPDTSVYLTVEVEAVVMPNLMNMYLQNASSLLKNQGLRIGKQRKELTDDRYRPGDVIMQSIPAGTRVAPGTIVDLSIAEPGVRVPNLEKTDLKYADSILKKSGLRRGKITWTRSSEYSPETILSQWPRAGTLIKHGDAVDLKVVEKPPVRITPVLPREPYIKMIPNTRQELKECIVPDLMGLTYTQAQRKLKQTGFLGRKIQISGDKVTQQKPSANTKAPCGSVVEFSIGILY